MRVLKRYNDKLSKLEAFLSSFFLASIVLVNFVEIVQRNLFALSFPWVQELSLILVSWVVFLGAAYIYKKETLLCVDFLYLKSKGAIRFLWEMTWHIGECIILAVLVVYGWKYSMSQTASFTYSLGINRAAYSIPLVYCSVSMLIGLAEKGYDTFHNYRAAKKEA